MLGAARCDVLRRREGCLLCKHSPVSASAFFADIRGVIHLPFVGSWVDFIRFFP